MSKDKLEKLSFEQIRTINKAMKYTNIEKSKILKFWREYNKLGD